MASPARAHGRAAAAGGILSCVPRHLPSVSHRHLASDPSQRLGAHLADLPLGPIDFWDWVPHTLYLQGGLQVTVIMLYLTCGIGLSGAKLVKLAGLGAFLKLLVGPWIILGDFNITPEELSASRWLTGGAGGRGRPPHHLDPASGAGPGLGCLECVGCFAALLYPGWVLRRMAIAQSSLGRARS